MTCVEKPILIKRWVPCGATPTTLVRGSWAGLRLPVGEYVTRRYHATPVPAEDTRLYMGVCAILKPSAAPPTALVSQLGLEPVKSHVEWLDAL